MKPRVKIKHNYITDDKGTRTKVALFVEDYQDIIEDLEDLNYMGEDPKSQIDTLDNNEYLKSM